MGDASSARIHYEVFGSGIPLILGYPITASSVPGMASQDVAKGYLQLLTDRYRVLLMDYPGVGRSEGIPVHGFTVQRVCRDLLHVADAAGFDRFIWWGFSWGGLIGLHLATQSERVAALVCGGWPPLDGPYAEMLSVVRARAADASIENLPPVAPFVTFYESVQAWPESASVRRIGCPKMVFVGSDDDLELGDVKLQLAKRIVERRGQLESGGWHVAEIPGKDHSVYADPETVVPIVRNFLDSEVIR